MALEFQINTEAAQKAIADLASELDTLTQAQDNLNTQGIDELASKTASVQPVSADVATSLEQVSEASDKVGESATKIDGTTQSIEKLGETAPSSEAAAASIDKVAQSTEKLDPHKPDELTEALSKINQAAAGASQGMGGFTQGAEGAASGLSGLGSKLLEGATHGTVFAEALGAGRAAMSAFAAATNPVAAALAAVSAAIGTIDFKKLSEEGLKLAQDMEQLNRAMMSTYGAGKSATEGAKISKEAIEKLKEVAKATAFDFEAMIPKFTQWGAIAKGAGLTFEQSAAGFKAVATAARNSGTDFEHASGTLSVMERWMATGTATAGLVGRALREMNIALVDINPKWQGLTRNTQLGSDALKEILVYMAKMKPAAFTLQEDIKLLATEWKELAVEFGHGEMATQTAAMNTLLQTVRLFEPQLATTEFALGALWGAFKALGNYIEAGFLAAWGSVVAIIQAFAAPLSGLSEALIPVKDVFRDLGTILTTYVGPAFTFVAGEILNTAKVLGQLFAMGIIAAIALCRNFGEALGNVVGFILGGWYNAFMKAGEWLNQFVGWLGRGYDAMANWLTSKLPAWLTDAFGSAIDTAIAKVKEWAIALDKGAVAVVAAGTATQGAVEPAKALADADHKGTQEIDAKTLANIKLAQAAKERSAVEAEIAKRAAIIYYSPQPSFKQNNDGTYGPQMKAPGGGGGGGGGQQQPGTGPYGGGTSGSYHDFADNAMGQLMSSVLRQAYKDGNTDLIERLNGVPQSWLGGQVGPQQQFGNAPELTPGIGTPVTLVDPQGNPIGTDSNPLGAMPFNQIPLGQGGQTPPAQTQEGFNKDIAQQVADAMQRTQNIVPDAFKATINDLEQAQQQRAIQEQAVFDAEKKVQQENTGAIQAAAEQYTKDNADLQGKLGDLGTKVDDNTGKLADTTTGLDQLDTTNKELQQVTSDNVQVDRELVIADKNLTAATDAGTNAQDAANAAAAGAAAGGGVTGSNETTGGGGPNDQGGTVPNQNNLPFGNDPRYLDTGGVVGQWGGHSGPSVPMSAWDNAKSFAGGGITDGGIPIIAHPNEAVVPLQNGSIPITFLGNSQMTQSSVDPTSSNGVQAVQDTRQTIINVGNLAHQDMITTDALLQQLLIGLQDVAAAVALSARSSSSISSTLSSISSSSISSGGQTNNGAHGKFMRGAWGTSTNGGYIPQNFTNAYQSGGQYYDANGKLINVGGAADGLENTNQLAGMSSRGVPLVVHPDEAVVNLDGGGRIPVTLPGNPERGGGNFTGGGHASGQAPIHITLNVPIRDTTVWGHGPSADQIATDIADRIRRAVGNNGQPNSVDDPTRRVGAGVRGTANGTPAGLIL